MTSTIELVPVSESLAMAETAARYYTDDPMVGLVLGSRNGTIHRRLAIRNCIVTSDALQRIYSTPSREAFVHVAEAGSWRENLHQFILRGTMKIPFVIDSGTIERLCGYREACESAVPDSGLAHVSAVYFEDGREEVAAEILSSVCDHAGGCYSVAHTGRQASVLLDSGFVLHKEIEYGGVRCRLMLRAG
ncbi:MAG: hypothetical protein IKR86_01865 [Candidatus Methanomethylophilaceae archaeon]|nr:hypothetical protein [Candidatus Methanomethylophilaceae archaeon]